MANRNFEPCYSYGTSRIYAEFNFQANGASQPVLSTVDGANIVASLNRTGTGIIVVTLKDPFYRVVAVTCDVDDTLNDGAYATVGNVTNEGTATPIQFTIRTRTAGGTAADMAAARKIQVLMAFKNSNQGTQ
jgi:hypothetical protein